MYPVRPALQRYGWGSETDLPDLLGFEPDGGPYAEAWWGAHPGGPALAGTAGEAKPLDAVIAQDPEAALGGESLAAFGERLPYLLKVLAIARPLSIQVHPSLDVARAGFAREEEAGIPRDAPDRVFRDDNHKPEMIIALTPMVLLSGFRKPSKVREDIAGIGGPVAERLATLCADDQPDGLAAFLRGVMADEEAPGLVSDLAFVGARRGASANLAVAAHAASAYPGDRGALVALAMNVVNLEPGEACFTSDGIVHSYQSGVGLEIMANSDNVIRAGLTGKHIDVAALLDVSVTTPGEPFRPAVTRDGRATHYAPPVREFGLAIADGGEAVFGSGPRMVVALEGEAVVRSAGEALTLPRGGAAFVPDSDGPATVASAGRAAVAFVPLSP
ncbi:MAG: mannose-6-phosphate isomerase, class I [Demequinaceae bacterium]|nr:mannose-6-phosphate isomerase, class I [Demequinaceae bacterium]